MYMHLISLLLLQAVFQILWGLKTDLRHLGLLLRHSPWISVMAAVYSANCWSLWAPWHHGMMTLQSLLPQSCEGKGWYALLKVNKGAIICKHAVFTDNGFPKSFQACLHNHMFPKVVKLAPFCCRVTDWVIFPPTMVTSSLINNIPVHL